jgi:hypothetical protein
LRIEIGAYSTGLVLITVACAADVSDYRFALDANGFSDYRIETASDDTRRRRERSLETFDDDVLLGDFNFDGRADFAAILSRSATESEIESSYLPPGKDAANSRSYVAVVCNGLAEASATGRYKCAPLSDITVGGFGGELTILDPGEWGEDLSTVIDAAGNPQCARQMTSYTSQLLLAHDEPLGRCTTYYYPKSKGSYGTCIYCAD